MNLWEIAEYIGETLVFIGVAGEVFAAWKDPPRKRLENASSIVLVFGLAISLAALIGTNERFNSTIADLNAQAGESRKAAGEAELGAANARRDTAQLVKDNQELKTEEAEAKLELARLTAPVHLVPAIHGVATPDLSAGLTQRVLLRADTRIAPPHLPAMPNGGSLTWTLFLDQDSVGQHQPTIEFAPLPNKLFLPPNTRSIFKYVTDDHGRTTDLGWPVLNGSIPSELRK